MRAEGFCWGKKTKVVEGSELLHEAGPVKTFWSDFCLQQDHLHLQHIYLNHSSSDVHAAIQLHLLQPLLPATENDVQEIC